MNVPHPIWREGKNNPYESDEQIKNGRRDREELLGRLEAVPDKRFR